MSKEGLDRNDLLHQEAQGFEVVGSYVSDIPIRNQLRVILQRDDRKIETKFPAWQKNGAIMALLRANIERVPVKRAFVLGNGPSLGKVNLNNLIGERCYGVNRIWQMWEKYCTKWRPSHYVRGELPTVNRDEVREDAEHMRDVRCISYIEAGLEYVAKMNSNHKRVLFHTCDASRHDWHLPIICGYGTVVHMAIQIAVLEGAESIYLLGCDLGNEHFYQGEFTGTKLALDAHLIAKKCCPVPIYNATPGGSLEVYERVNLDEISNNR